MVPKSQFTLIFMLFLSCCFSSSMIARTTDPGDNLNSSSPDSMSKKSKNPEVIPQIISGIKLNGYIQGRFQYGEENALLHVGQPNEHPGEESFSRIGIRRSRLKLSYSKNITTGVFEIDMTEKGISVKDVYISVKDPFWKTASYAQFGTYNRPFGVETQMSSSAVESPERATVGQTLFPGEKDMGGMLSLKAPENSLLSDFELQGGLFAGNGVNQETDSKLDFIGRAGFRKTWKNSIRIGIGISGYYGGIYQGTADVYTMNGSQFVLNDDPDNLGKYAKRAYFGADAEFKLPTPFGTTMLRGEYITGSQPGSLASSASPNSGTRPAYDTYVRNFCGYYILLTQNIGKLPLIWVMKYDFYDPNTSVTGDEIGVGNTGVADIAQGTFGAGITWLVDNSFQMQVYYNFVSKEQTINLSAYNKNLKDNTFTFGLQFKF